MEVESLYKKPTTFQTQLFINNQFVDGVKGQKIEVVNPATEEVITSISEATQEDVEKAIDAAEAAFPAWSRKSQKQRSELLFKLASLIERDINDLTATESLDNGKPLDYAYEDIAAVVSHLRYFAGWADKITGSTYTTPSQQLFYTRREPYGVVGLISPWNFPLLMAEWKFGPALAAGNCIVLKPSEVTPLSVLKVAALFKEAGFPAGVVNIVPGFGHTAGETLTTSHRISKISFTGSTVIGRRILEASAKTNLKKVVLELGGKSPVIVCPDADLDKAAETVWNAIMFNMGQSCDAGSRLFVHESVHDQLLEKLKNISETVIIGDAFDEGTNHGPQVSKIQFERVMAYLDHARDVEKLNVLIGGDRALEKGYFIQPTIYTGVADDSKLAQEEIFGPVLVVLKPWKTLEEVIQRANNTRYGLAAYLLTNNMGNVERVTREVRAGSFYVNGGSCTENLPFGGFKESGFGRDNGEEGLLEYTQIKSVYLSFERPLQQ